MAAQQTFSEAFQAAHAALEADGERWPDLRLAVFLDTTPTTIWAWRKGKREPDVVKQEGVLKRLRDEARKKKPKP